MVDGLIPAGPLHPDHAAVAIAAGVAVALIARRNPRRWLSGVVVAVACVVIHRQGNVLVEGYRGRPDAGLAVAATIATAAVGVGLRPCADAAALAVAGSAAAVWMIVPDTEAPLAALLVTTAALIRPPAPQRSPWAGALLTMPVVAAVVGSAGRPARLAPSLAAATAVLVCVFAAIRCIGWRRAQRAGTPTTVVSAGTSSTTTAPAPTTAP